MLVKREVLFEYAHIDTPEVLKELNSSRDGLLEHEAKRRLEEFGHNVLAKKKEISIVKEFFSHFLSPLTLILLFAAGVSAYLGEHINAVIIFVMVFLSVVLDFLQEHSAEKAVEKLVESVKTTVTVIRHDEKKEIRTADVCIGDVIFLNSGDLIPADARIISAKDFFVNQSALTGESFPCEKNDMPVSSDKKSLSELTNLVFAGTSVISGSATAVVLRTGRQTEFGKIASSLSKAEAKSEFEYGINHFGYFIMKIMIFLVLFIFLFNSIVNKQVFESFMFAVAIAVGVTPELLPMIMSVTMARGSRDMAKKGAIVKKLVSIPNFGSMDVLCTDKTGTLTQDRIVLVNYTDIAGKHSDEILMYAYLNSFYQTGIKNPLDDAVIHFKRMPVEEYKKIDEIPFDFLRRRMSIVVSDSPKEHIIITKGAPEELFKICSSYKKNGKLSGFGKNALIEAENKYHELSSHGYKVLAIAAKKVKKAKKVYEKEDEKELCLLGFVSFLDPPKKDVKEVLEHLEKIGVEIKVVTGDNEFVTKKICDEIGLPVKGILVGKEVAALSDEALKGRVENTTIFARVLPEQKNRIIHILKSNGHVVGYLGDGINDSPSLKNADVGITVNNAVDVAKESADIVLTHKSLHVLKEGIIDGRKAFGNTMKYLMMGISSNFGNMFSAAGAILFLPFLPMLPIQILLNNFIYDFSQITIPGDPVDDEWVKKPKRWDMKFIKKFMYLFGPISSMFDFLTFFTLFFILKVGVAEFQTGWFLESLATQTLVIHIIRTKKIPFLQSMPGASLLLSTVLCVVFGWIIVYSPLGSFFGFEPPPLKVALILVGIVFLYLTTIQIVKSWFFKRHNF